MEMIKNPNAWGSGFMLIVVVMHRYLVVLMRGEIQLRVDTEAMVWIYTEHPVSGAYPNLLTQTNCQIQIQILSSWKMSNSQTKIKSVVVLERSNIQLKIKIAVILEKSNIQIKIQILVLLGNSNTWPILWFCLNNKLSSPKRNVVNLILLNIIIYYFKTKWCSPWKIDSIIHQWPSDGLDHS